MLLKDGEHLIPLVNPNSSGLDGLEDEDGIVVIFEEDGNMIEL
jgi:hypothetical protein